MRALLALSALALATAPLAGCTPAAPGSTPATAAAPCPPAPTDADPEQIVTAAELCAIDGRPWSDSVFTTVVNTPAWGDTTPACDEARKTAFYKAWKDVQSQITTFDLATDFGENARLLGGVGVAVLTAPDASAPIALLDAEVDACLGASAQTRIDHGPWRGVRGPLSGDDGEQLTWWAEGDGHWSLVQAYISETLSADDAASLESALDTLLDAQAARLAE
ncbi:hypothetical protein ITJ64_11585 [Herbiconiux sp. VKM Ac-1786]|uniref:hypothetical protein n=1 Tax=Herbiconiux sp. VKM Ac-1786 TaxID=2783824 RepID=UPI00188A80DF|nr:hypothetical protein [Herbiconiux sp. VKM Ac-1786]MBF4573161.1 hypothetical protein [Herbiconiux sp. VKM Ac-1786]